MIRLVSPVSVSGKMIYRDTCDNNIPWDKELAQDLKNSWNNWRRRLPRKIEVPGHTEMQFNPSTYMHLGMRAEKALAQPYMQSYNRIKAQCKASSRPSHV